ncbi:MAG: FAD-binding oxidoreductase [Candidatus Saccharibacteria bacterium]|nr:FAD-binding oxidoreductase [Candidatus Saccharibacteria bacterium]
MHHSLTVTVEKVRRENPEVVTLYFRRPFAFTAGQYITVYIPGSAVTAGKAYSLSSLPHEELASITVKDVGGEFSSYLCQRAAGDELRISQPYGYFNPQTTRPLVGIAAGCALGPVWSVLASAEQDTYLYFSHRSPDRTVFDEELANSRIRVTHFSTRQKVEEVNGWRNGRFEVAAIVQEASSGAHFLVCGSVDFVRNVWQKLVAAGVDTQRISTETFFES